MHDIDSTLKLLLMQLNLKTFGIEKVIRWESHELPEVRALRVDLLGRTRSGKLIHIEIQSNNDGFIATRMAEYRCAIYRRYGIFPVQIVLYVGKKPLRMSDETDDSGFGRFFRIVDIRELDGEKLLASPRLGENMVAVLARLGNQREAVAKIVRRIARTGAAKRGVALRQFLILAGLRDLEDMVNEEVRKVPVLDSVLDNRVLGPPFKRGLKQGMEEGLEKGLEKGLVRGRVEGREEGLLQGERLVLTRLVEKRFGRIPVSARRRLDRLTSTETEEAALRLLDAARLEEIFG